MTTTQPSSPVSSPSAVSTLPSEQPASPPKSSPEPSLIGSETTTPKSASPASASSASTSKKPSKSKDTSSRLPLKSETKTETKVESPATDSLGAEPPASSPEPEASTFRGSLSKEEQRTLTRILEGPAKAAVDEILRKDEFWWASQVAPLFQNYGLSIEHFGGVRALGTNMKTAFLGAIEDVDQYADLMWTASISDRASGDRIRTHFMVAAIPLVVFSRLYL